MIALTGDGTSEETAFKVILQWMNTNPANMLTKWKTWKKGQSLVNKCDLIEFDKCQYYEGNQMYFDIKPFLDYMVNYSENEKKTSHITLIGCHKLCVIGIFISRDWTIKRECGSAIYTEISDIPANNVGLLLGTA